MKLNWHSADQEQVIEALRAVGTSPMYGTSFPSSSDFGQVRYAVSHEADVVNRRVKIVLLGDERKEFFSWTSTYAEDVFPVSMCARVMPMSDWKAFEFDYRSDLTEIKNSSVWASIVLGELLGQSQGDVDAASAPIGRSPACFSYAVARAELLYPENLNASKEVTKRLTSTVKDRRFGRRAVGLEALSPVWAIYRQLSHLPSEDLASPTTIIRILDAVDPEAAELLSKTELLSSDFAELRIEGFDELIDQLFYRRSPTKHIAPALAAAALLAGRGTSHIQLLAPVGREFPQVFAWFGMFAGVLGSKYWDLAWTRGAKSVDRLLRQPFRVDEPVRADLCWAEFEWLSEMFSSEDVFVELPKSAQRSLLIEILPGVEFQLGLPSRERANGPIPAYSEPAISSKAVDEALKLIEAAHTLLRGDSPIKQADFFDSASPTQSTKKVKASSTGRRGSKLKP
ncbi:hypothetical protein ATN89_08880 [Comamonas thiooxydans]|uniref:hypothetical protein n=1 Tax=Comamonas thiooxydans TaxID=363952 RepID=UPI0007C566A5|nr:hypothetical protein [Comamonas thiooxydans]OAD84539.1 hypothetical protein ATN89_08880 [Comamonas thiooxydans]